MLLATHAMSWLLLLMLVLTPCPAELLLSTDGLSDSGSFLPNSTVTTLASKIDANFLLLSITFPNHNGIGTDLGYFWVISPYPALFLLSDSFRKINNITLGALNGGAQIQDLIFDSNDDNLPNATMAMKVTTLLFELMTKFDKEQKNYLCFSPGQDVWTCCQDINFNFNASCPDPVPHYQALSILSQTQQSFWMIPVAIYCLVILLVIVSSIYFRCLTSSCCKKRSSLDVQIETESTTLVPPAEEASLPLSDPMVEEGTCPSCKSWVLSTLLDLHLDIKKLLYPLHTAHRLNVITLTDPDVPVWLWDLPISNLFTLFWVWFFTYGPPIYLMTVLVWTQKDDVIETPFISFTTVTLLAFLSIFILSVVWLIVRECRKLMQKKKRASFIDLFSSLLVTISLMIPLLIPVTIYSYWTIVIAFIICLFLSPVATAYRVAGIIFVMSLFKTAVSFFYGQFPSVLEILLNKYGGHFVDEVEKQTTTFLRPDKADEEDKEDLEEDEDQKPHHEVISINQGETNNPRGGGTSSKVIIITVEMYYKICRELKISWGRQAALSFSFFSGGVLLVGLVLYPLISIVFTNLSDLPAALEPFVVIIAGFLPRLFEYFQPSKAHDAAFIERVKRATDRVLEEQ